MPSEWRTIAGAAKTLEDELGMAPGKARQSVIEAVARHRLPTRWMAEDDATKIERLRLAPGESLRIGVSGDPETTFVLPLPKERQLGAAEPKPNADRPSRKTHRWGTALVHVPAILALALGEPRAACREMAEAAMPEHLREPEPADGADGATRPEEAEMLGEPPPPDDLQAVADDCMTDYLKKHKIDRGPGQRPQFATRDNSILDCYRLVKGRGVKWEQVKAAYVKAPAWPEAGPDALRGTRKPGPK